MRTDERVNECVWCANKRLKSDLSKAQAALHGCYADALAMNDGHQWPITRAIKARMESAASGDWVPRSELEASESERWRGVELLLEQTKKCAEAQYRVTQLEAELAPTIELELEAASLMPTANHRSGCDCQYCDCERELKKSAARLRGLVKGEKE